MGRQLRQAGYAVVSLDIQMGVRGNVLLRVVERLLKGWITSGAVLCWGFGSERRAPRGRRR